MSAATRLLASIALMVGLCPAIAIACDDDAAKATADAKIVTIKVDAKVLCDVKVKTVCKDKMTNATTTEVKFIPKNANTQGGRHNWEPGHLIEPDSMKLGPDLDSPDNEQWVILSSRGGMVVTHKLPWSKKEGRTTYPVYGPYRIVLLPQLP